MWNFLQIIIETILNSFQLIVKIYIELSVNFSTSIVNFIMRITEKTSRVMANLIRSLISTPKNKRLVLLLESKGFAGVILRLLTMYFFLGLSIISMVVMVDKNVQLTFFSFLQNINSFYYFCINLLIFLISIISFIYFFLLTGERAVDTKIIVNFLNKSILPFITLLIVLGNFSLSNPESLSLVKKDRTINFASIYLNVLPTILVVLYNGKLAYLQHNEIISTNAI